MKKIILAYLIGLSPYLLKAQEPGIHFEEALTWQQLQAKAKVENKYIFMDCFATWCVPCKVMDKDVYNSPKVGDAINDKFLSVKVQFDKTEFDDSTVKKWYFDAIAIQKGYSVNAYPTFLFFSPDGKPVHKAVGYKNPEAFIELSKEVFNPKKQYYSILRDFKPGLLDTIEMKGLANSLLNSDHVLASRIASDYLSRIPKAELANHANVQFMANFKTDSIVSVIAVQYLGGLSREELSGIDNLNLAVAFKNEPSVKVTASDFIDHLTTSQLYTKRSIALIKAFTNKPEDKGFDMFYHHAAEVDAVMGKQNYSQSIVDGIITKMEISPLMIKAGPTPDFEGIRVTITKKYGSAYADRNILSARVRWYEFKQDWPEYTKYFIQNVETNGFDKSIDAWTGILNNFVWDALFLHDASKEQVNTGLKWMEQITKTKPTYTEGLDTYANLLYKSGQTEKAISLEEKAIEVDPKRKSYKEALRKMKAGEPTWTLPDEKNP